MCELVGILFTILLDIGTTCIHLDELLVVIRKHVRAGLAILNNLLL